MASAAEMSPPAAAATQAEAVGVASSPSGSALVVRKVKTP